MTPGPLMPFELELFGGPAEAYFRKIRPGIEDAFPWGSLAIDTYAPELVVRARTAWTRFAFNEYATAAAFAELARALLAARAPVDLVAMASDFVADEIAHVELASRLAMDLGGGAPFESDFGRLTPPISSSVLTPLQCANEQVIRLCCIGETFSVRMLAGAARAATHPLTHRVLRRIVEDEAQHSKLGWLYLEWISDQLDDAERARLAGEARRTIEMMRPSWSHPNAPAKDGVTAEGFVLAHVHELGWMETSDYAATARDAILTSVIAPPARWGIAVPAEALGAGGAA